MNKFPIENIDKVNASKNADLSSKATQLATSRDIILSGDASGSASFNGTDNASITVTVTDDSHNHTIANIDNLQTILDEKLDTSGGNVNGNLVVTTSSLGLKIKSSVIERENAPSENNLYSGIEFLDINNARLAWIGCFSSINGNSGVLIQNTVANKDFIFAKNGALIYGSSDNNSDDPHKYLVRSVNNITADESGNVTLSASAFPSGTKMLFHQSAAPTGWTKQTSIDDSALRVVSGDTGGGTGGSVAFSTLFATGKTVSLSGNVGATTLTVSQMPSHSHVQRKGSINNNGDITIIAGHSATSTTQSNTNTSTASTGGSGSHTHTLSGTASIALNVKYTDVIICSKD